MAKPKDIGRLLCLKRNDSRVMIVDHGKKPIVTGRICWSTCFSVLGWLDTCFYIDLLTLT